MKLLIVTSAFSNEDLLLNCVNSWPRHPDVGAAVYFDGLHYESVFSNKQQIPDYIHQIRPSIPDHIGCSGSWNRLLNYWYMQTDATHILIVGSDTFCTNMFSISDLLEEIKEKDVDYAPIEDLRYNALCLSRKAYETIGTFDENFYPAYYEDGDYHQRAIRSSGLTTGTLGKNSWIIHRGSQTIKRDKKFEQACVLTFEMNKTRYLKKWGGNRQIEATETNATPYNDPTQTIKDWVLDEEERKKKFDIWNN